MRKFVLILAVLFMTVPAMAVPNVAITCVPDGNKVTVSYAVTGSPQLLIRAFGLDIDVVGANITKVVPVDANYRIYPGQIVITGGNVTNYSTPYDPCDIGDANVTIEMGSLYTMDSNYASDPNAGYNKKPGLSGTLLKFYVSDDCTYAVTENAIRGGVVMEDPTVVPNVTLCSGSVVVGCTVPNVVGKLKDVADANITAAGLVPNGTGVMGCAPLNEVLTQDPAGSTVVTCGSTVNYTYSLYQTTVPNVVGGSKDAADAAILAANLVPNGTGVLSCVTLNQVLTQNPGVGVVTCNTTVNYTYSLYQTTVPDVVGMTEPNADAAIIAAGFTVGTKTVSATCGAIPDFKIISSTPNGGSTATCGSAVATVRCECFAGQGKYASWVTVGKPKCWCYPRQCHGDADGKRHGTSTLVGYWWVGQPDLDVMLPGWLVKDPPKGSGVIGRTTVGGIPLICADFGRDRHGTSTLVGYWWIGQPDLDKMLPYWLKKEPPKGSGTPADCLPGNRNP